MRNPLIDIAKGLGILLVVFGHNWIIVHDQALLYRLIFSFHMPLFFFLSGVVSSDTGDLRSYLLKRADTLLKPYFVVLTIWGLLRIAQTGQSWRAYFSGLLYGTGYTIEWTPLWFLPHLFLSLILLALLLRLSRRWPQRTLWLCVVAAILLLAGVYALDGIAQIDKSRYIAWNPWLNNHSDDFPGLPWSLDLVPITCAYLLAGYLLKARVMALRFHLTGFILALTLFAVLHGVFSDSMDLHLRHYGNLWVSAAQSALGIYLCLSVAVLLLQLPRIAAVLTYLGSASLFILIFHSWFEWKVFNVLAARLHADYLSAMIAFVAGVCVPLILLVIVQRSRYLRAVMLPGASGR